MAALQLSCKRILGFPAVLFLPALLCSVWGHHCSELQYPLKKQKCCRKCQPGTELTKRCGMSSDTTCEPCDPGSYNEDYTESRCKTCSVCRKDMGLREVRPCEAKFNARCECLPGYEPSEEYSTDEKRCKPCREGCFSRGGSQKCQPWTDCAAQGKTQKFPGKREEDAICSNEQVVAPTESTSVTVRSSPEDKKTEPSTKNVSSVSVTHAKTEQVDIRRSNSQS
uniref:TNFR-Cys domain-containing protein n=1 Tax=Salvator merianae TaxID=96440 RepID=A0A8D0BQ89_SALMN